MAMNSINGTNQVAGVQSTQNHHHKGHHHKTESSQNSFQDLLNSLTQQNSTNNTSNTTVPNSIGTVTGGVSVSNNQNNTLDSLI